MIGTVDGVTRPNLYIHLYIFPSTPVLLAMRLQATRDSICSPRGVEGIVVLGLQIRRTQTNNNPAPMRKSRNPLLLIMVVTSSHAGSKATIYR
jgi:hypothetical protein